MNDKDEPEFGFTDAFARRTDPKTSADAARSIRITQLEGKVLRKLQEMGEATTHELSAYMGIGFWSVTPRIRPLVRKGFVIDSGKRRPGQSGRNSIVWKTT